jgi:hypothetical protein
VTKSPTLKYCSPDATAGVIIETPPAGSRGSYEVWPVVVVALVVEFELVLPVTVDSPIENVVVAPFPFLVVDVVVTVDPDPVAV